MNFLQLCQRLRRKCRIVGTGPVAVTAQAEEYARVVDWVNESWVDIQSARQDWQWMRKSCSFVTIAGQATYTPAQAGITDWGNWTRDTWRNYVTATGTNSEIEMPYVDYENWRDQYQFGATRATRSQPTVITIAPDKQIGLGPVPAAGYTVTGDYFSLPSEMAATAETPALPVQFHMAIVYRAMMYYGVSEAANEVYQEGKIEFELAMRRLQLNQMPEIGSPDALA